MTYSATAAVKGAVLAALIGLATPSISQAQGMFSETKLKAFVTAAIVVEERIRQWAPRIQGAESQQAAELLRAQANAAFVEAIQDTKGITVQEYQTINEAARTDPKLLAKIQQIYTVITAQ